MSISPNSINYFEIIRELKGLNPGVEILTVDDQYNLIYCSIPMERLKLPNGFYFSDKNGITNKHRTESGLYASIDVRLIK